MTFLPKRHCWKILYIVGVRGVIIRFSGDIIDCIKTSSISMGQNDDKKMYCRMYKDPYPEINDLVMVKVRKVAEMGAYVELLEYKNMEGMVLLSEISRRRIRSVQKLIRVGKNEVAVVLRVDKEKGYIDLSKRKVLPEEIEKCEEKYKKSKAVYSIIRNVAETNDVSMLSIYEDYVWPLCSVHSHAYDAFKISIGDPKSIFPTYGEGDKVLNDLVNSIRNRLLPQKIKFRADIEVYCDEYDGVDAVKEALRAGEASGTEQVPLKIKLVSPPLYVVFAQCFDEKSGVEIMDKATTAIEKEINARGGSFNYKMKPKIISDAEEMELYERMKRAELENAEVSGDEDTSDIE